MIRTQCKAQYFIEFDNNVCDIGNQRWHEQKRGNWTMGFLACSIAGILIGIYIFHCKYRACATIGGLYLVLFKIYDEGTIPELALPHMCIANSPLTSKPFSNHTRLLAYRLQSYYETIRPFIKPYFPTKDAFRNLPKNTKYNWENFILAMYTRELIKLLESDQSHLDKKEFMANITKTHLLCCKILESGTLQCTPDNVEFFNDKCKDIFANLDKHFELTSEDILNSAFMATLKSVKSSYVKIVESIQTGFIEWSLLKAMQHVAYVIIPVALIYYAATHI